MVGLTPAARALERWLSNEVHAASQELEAELHEVYNMSHSGFSIVQLGAGYAVETDCVLMKDSVQGTID